MKKIVSLILLAIPLVVAAHPGIGIVEDSKGNIFYSDLKQVWKIDVNGIKKVAVKNVHTHELYLDEQDNLYGEHLWYNGERLDTWGHFVWKLNARGEFEKIIPDKEGFLENYSFVRDHFGRMYWADRSEECQRVVRKNLDNTLLVVSEDCFKNIRWMKSGANGAIYVVDLVDLKVIDRRGNTSLVKSALDDRKLSQFHVSDQHAIFGVWDDREGNIYTAIYSGRTVKKFSPDGSEQVIITTPIPWSPTGGLVDRTGALWILENSTTNAVRVERISKNGMRNIY